MQHFIEQFVAFGLIAAFGYLLSKKKVLSKDTANQMSNILILYIIPLLIFQSFLRPYDAQEAVTIIVLLAFTAVVQGVFMLLARILFGPNHRMERYATIFNNKAFVGLPIAAAIFGPSSAFYVAPSIVMSNVLLVLYGMPLLSGKAHTGRLDLMAFLRKPVVLAFLLGIAVYLLQIPVPQVIMQPIQGITSINSPLAMILIGSFIAEKPLGDLLRDRRVWKVSFVRLIVFPLVAIGLLVLLPYGTSELKIVTAIAWSCPTAMNLALLASMFDLDTYYGSQIVVSTSIFCAFTIPMILIVAQFVFQ